MSDQAAIFVTLGVILLLGVLADLVGRRMKLPRVTLLILAGIAIGPAGLDLLPASATAWYPLVSKVALLIIGFLLGGRLAWRHLEKSGRRVLSFSAFEVLGVAVALFLGLWIAGAPLAMALVLAGIAPASAPAAVVSVVDKLGAKGDFTDSLLGIVAVDDAWGLIVFSVMLAVAAALAGGGGWADALTHGGRELGMALLVGIALGVPSAWLVGRVRGGDPMEAEALGMVLLAGGAALYLGASFILAAMVLGAAVINLGHEEHRPFDAVEKVEWPVLVIFFVLAGAEADLGRIAGLGLVGGVYVVLRAAGLVAGAWLGGTLAGAPMRHRVWMGPAILPQAGVALGMALVAGDRLPDLKQDIIAVVIGSTVLFEILGPVLTRVALVRTGDAGRGADASRDVSGAGRPG